MQKTVLLLSILLLLANCGSSAKQSDPTPMPTVSPTPIPTAVVDTPSPNINDSSKIPPAIPVL